MDVLDLRREAVPLVEGPAEPLPEHARLRRLRVAYFLAIPFAIGSFFGWARYGALAAVMPREAAVIYGGVMSVLLWQLRWLVAGALLQWRLAARLPLPLLLAGAATLSELVTRPLHRAARIVISPLFDAPIPSFANWIPLTPAEIGTMLIGCSPLILAWIGVTYVYERWLGVPVLPQGPRARPVAAPPPAPEPAPEPEVAPAAPEPAEAGPGPDRLTHRLPPRFGKVRVLRALDHYVEVHGDDGTARVLYRFEDAVRELADTGLLRVHRSFCIDTAAAVALGSQGRRRFVRLDSGLRVPVSATYLEALLSQRPDLRSRRPRRSDGSGGSEGPDR